MESEKKKIELRMTIEGTLAERLTKIKDHYQFETYTDTIRFLVTSKYEDLVAKK